MPERRIAIIDPFHPRIIETIRAALHPGWELAVTEAPEEAARARALAQADAAFVMATPMPASLLTAAPGVRFIQKLGAGVDRIDTEHCAAHGIALARLQAGNAIPVAEHALLLMLAAARRLPRLDAQTRAGRWDKEAVRGENRHLHGKTVGIVGFGAIGRQLARLLAGFDVKIVYYDPQRADPEEEAALGVRHAGLDALISEADVLSLHLPLLPQTAGLISAERIAAMKPGVILVNAARGGLVDEGALVDALRTGHVSAAGLDAFAEEPPVGNPLLELPNTVVTPHCAGATIDNFANVAARAVDNYRRFLAGQDLPAQDVVVPPPGR